MKITQSHYEHLKTSIDTSVKKLGIDKVSEYYMKLENKDIECNNAKVRIMYDLMKISKLNTFVCDELYKYCNDSHITTALLKIGSELKIYN